MTKPKKPTLKERFKNLAAEYGRVALVVYFSIFIAVYLGFLISISAGIGETDTAGTVSTAGAAWLATKVTQPLRIGATFLLTPLVAKLYRRFKPLPEAEMDADEDEDAEEDAAVAVIEEAAS